MDFNEVISQRKTSREWTDEEVDFAAIRRILAAGMKAPSWDHYRNWQFIYPAGTGRKRTGLCLRPGGCPALRGGEPRLHPAQPGAKNVCPCHAAAVYHADGLSICDCAPVQMRRLNAEWVSKLNPLSTAWCVVENILLATINEGLGYSLRIPLNREHDVVLKALGVPPGWMTPCFIGVGYPKKDEVVLEQYSTSPEGHIHLGGW